MRMRMYSLILGAVLGTVVVLFPDPSHAQCNPLADRSFLPPNGGRPEVVQGFIQAMRTPGENARVAAVREYLRSVTKIRDWRVRNDLSYWLNQAWSTFDPTPYADLLGKLGCQELLDMSELREDRAVQLTVFGKALNDGEARLPRGTIVYASDAVSDSAEYGLTELEDDVAEYYMKTWTTDHRNRRGTKSDTEAQPNYVRNAFEELKLAFPYSTYKLDLELHAGGKDYDDANRLAARRLAEMPAQEFRDHIENDPGFSGVFWRIASYACAVNVFTGEQNDACEHIMKVYVHQMWLYRDLKKAGKPATWPDALRNLGGCVYQDLLFGEYGVVRAFHDA